MPQLNSKTQPEFICRIDALRPDSPRRFGTLTPAAMLAHLARSFEISLGERKVKDESTFFMRQIVKRIAWQTPMSLPKGKIKAPSYFTPEAKELEFERSKLIGLLTLFVEASEREPNRVELNPIFGPMTLRYWQRVHGKHCAHHFEQFSV